ncbi:MAG: DUF1214 domain-containing protein [Synechococcaceae cyanobacterium]|nr:DUF1214 domain-containing protein [Synechococcaceae cyanobacterium]
MTSHHGLDEATLQGDELITTPIGAIELVDSYFDDDASRRLFAEMDYQRAVQAYLWSLPLVSFAAWRDRQAQAFAVRSPTDVVVLRSLREKRGVVTANLTTPYALLFTSLAAGPLVIDYPAGETAGVVLDAWQRPVTDLGLTGPDRGRGGRYRITAAAAPHPAADADPAGVHSFRSETRNLLVGLRVLDPALEERFRGDLRIGRPGEDPRPCRFIENLDVEWDATPPRGLAYWQLLAAILQEEPVRTIDKPWMAMLRPLGIEPGHPFAPDRDRSAILSRAAVMGELMARNLQVNPRFARPCWEGTHWYRCIEFGLTQETDTRLELDERTAWFYEAVTTSEGMIHPRVGAGQVYLTTKRDRFGQPFRSDKTYRLRVPAEVPVAHFWALTLYSEQTRRPYDNGGSDERSVNIDSRRPDLRRNDDGSLDLFVGAACPPGWESNFLRSGGDDGWFVYFRLYAPLEPFFDGGFRLPDFQRID